MPITLINKQRRKRTFHLDHPAFGDESRSVTVTVVEESRDGGRYPRRVKKTVPGVLTLLSNEKRHGLSDHVLAVPAIKKAIEERTLAFLKVNAEPVAATEPTTTKSTRSY